MSGIVLPYSATAANRLQNSRGFMSVKCATPIQYTQRSARDALIQASLDPEVSSIEPLVRPEHCPPDTYFSFAVVIHNKRCAIALTEAINCTFDPPHGCRVGLAIDRASILSDPAKTTARTIWACRETNLPPLFSVKLLGRLRAHPAGIRLGDLEETLVEEPERWVDYTLAMVCAGLVIIDYRAPITDESLVRINLEQRRQTAFHWIG
ncbi:hypothetical protein IC608_16090 [Devosia sp. PTR5]|uniref:Uncharacterized protein n=1 Tax=Devosia oryzisoli TaxID=2774138 RepID=A0A927IUJ7_9HYPH|nr:hypothetical protein [Devosia oryzisoli]MBD8066992.1 hypothetical protein [Devosia oryzisoli]